MSGNLDELSMQIRIAIMVSPMPFLRAFAGTGVRRRRQSIGSLEIGERVSKNVSAMFRFYENGRRVEREELADFLAQHLLAVPDATAKQVTDKNSDVRSDAIDEVAAGLIKALAANWTISYEPPTPVLPGQGVKFHGPAA
ncbi:hypothetical protein [Agrobacterium sp. SORGH_AS 787]|uniref:hypothetical protein n=1 Tax=Agrobacterium sp. SORGH_AS 787 TaxID=3041775 RepID=UPI002784787D|nr:hypothetical protein [Rhizobium sp. SORGH_AS_0787]